MTFDPGTERQGRGYQRRGFSSLELNAQTVREPHLEERGRLVIGNLTERWTRALYHPCQPHRRPLISVFDHMAVVGEQTAHGCLPCLSVVL